MNQFKHLVEEEACVADRDATQRNGCCLPDLVVRVLEQTGDYLDNVVDLR